MKTYSYRCAAALLAVGVAAAPAGAGLDYGPCARSAFEDYLAAVGGSFEDFQGMPTGMNLTTQMPGVTFASTSNTSGAPAGPFHVEVSAMTFGPNTIVGSPCDPNCVDDGRVRYEITFDTPQRWAGMVRTWNTNSVTRFYNDAGGLLGEHQNTTGYEFVGWVADSDDPSGWVGRIVADGVPDAGGTRQVGYSDDLFYGTADVSGVEDPCPLDVDCNGEIGFGDLLIVLSGWGPCAGCRADLNGNGEIEFNDLLLLLSAWGSCP